MSASPAYLLIVDDEPVVRQSLARGLMEAGYACILAADGREALQKLRQGNIDVLLCDIRMPGMDGMEVLRQALRQDPDLLVVMVTALAGLQTALEALRSGAYDYITKPFSFEEIGAVVKRAMAYRQLRLENRHHLVHLEEMVEERTRQIKDIALGVITSLGLALEAKDEWTHDHSRRVAELAALLGRQLRLDDGMIADLRMAGMLHDIGKIGIREAVLHKPGELTAAEFTHIKLHPDLGARILSPLRELERMIPFIRHHHERWDGRGYPDGLSGEAIPLGARIIGVADAYVAMREHRPYRKGMSMDRTLNQLRIGAHHQFDLQIVGALLYLYERGILEEADRQFPQVVPELNID